MSADPSHDPVRGARWITWTQLVLGFVGACYLLLGFVMVPLMPFVMAAEGDPPPQAFTLAFTAVMFLVCAGVGGVNFLVAWGLAGRRQWAWIGALILGAMYAPSGCLPFGILVLYGMLNGDSRALFE